MTEPDVPPQAIHCLCRQAMTRAEVVPHPNGAVHLEFYACSSAACGRRAAVLWELRGTLSDEDRTWVEREVARRGYFFPSDYR